MSTSTKKDIVRGKRYSAEEKNKIVSFVEGYNATNGRGGQSAAAKKFGVSQLTVSNWLKGSGGKASGSKASGKGSLQSKLTALVALEQDIKKLEKELAAKRSKFDAIKASI